MLAAAVERWRPLATAAAARQAAAHGVTLPAELVLALIATESAGNPQATRTEPDGRVSRGLMQLLDATARDLGVATAAALYDPATNIEAGTRFLAQKLARYGGSIPSAIAAYNAGSPRYTTQETFVNQSYVDKVLGWFKKASPAAQAAAGGGAIAAMLAIAWLILSKRRGRRRAA